MDESAFTQKWGTVFLWKQIIMSLDYIINCFKKVQDFAGEKSFLALLIPSHHGTRFDLIISLKIEEKFFLIYNKYVICEIFKNGGASVMLIQS